MPRTMTLALSCASLGYHAACWRLPEMPSGGTMHFQHYAKLLETAQRGGFDMIFLADVMAARETGPGNPNAARVHHAVRHDPLMLLAALAPASSHIGLVATASTTYNEPFPLARRLATLDHISGGRAGWNIVTGYNVEEARNHGLDAVPDSKTRYARLYEFLDVVRGLWDSWDDDAFVHDKESGLYFNPAGRHTLDHRGQVFTVKGPLDVARPPQGYPVFVTAGESEGAKELAAQVAEVLYAGLPTLESAQAYYGSVKSRMDKYGRPRDGLKILAGVMAFVGRTDAEAKQKFDRLTKLIHPNIGLKMIEPIFGDLSAHKLDEKVPEHILATGYSSSYNDFAQRDAIAAYLVRRARAENLTVRQLYEAIAEGYWQLGVIGSAATVVDRMEEWLHGGACDGFIVQPPYIPFAVDDFVELVVPELRRRGLVRPGYTGATLRDNLDLARVPSRHTAPRPAAAVACPD